MDYSLCDQTVTVYHLSDDGVSRTVYPNAHLQIQDKSTEGSHGPELERAFLLVIPGEAELYPGDRVLLGEGREINVKTWANFVPANVENLCQIQYVQPCSFMGQICHTEAGRKLSTMYR